MIARTPPSPPLAAGSRPRLLPSPPIPNPKVLHSNPLAAGDQRHRRSYQPLRGTPQRKKANGGGTGRGGEEERHVHCEVDVVSWRERRIRACVLVDADVESVWSVLTDYERLADFIPNLVYSGRISCPHKGRIWLEQRGLQRALYWHIEARVVLDLQEFPNLNDGCELHFSMVDGDFKKFEGKWSVKAGPRSSTATLSYEVNVVPRFNFPAIFLERIICSDLPVNLRALAFRAERAESDHEENTKTSMAANGINASLEAVLSSSGLDLSSASIETDKRSPNTLREKYVGPTPSILTAPSTEFNSKWGVFGKVCRLDRPCMVDEVHLRRFDGLLENGGSHRCVLASITVKAPVREVWNVLTAYEELPEVVPNLGISKILMRDNNKVRILQEGCKGLLYMVLHARVVLDLHEKLEREISFEQVEGDFDSFRGKWLLQQLGNHHTLLKYMVESKLHKDTFLSEALVEEVIYEDLPSNLCAIRDFVEKREGAANDHLEDSDSSDSPVEDHVHIAESRPPEYEHSYPASNHSRQRPMVPGLQSDIEVLRSVSRQRPKVPGLQSDIEVLRSELTAFISEYGQEGFMPMRKHLRLHGRVDIEKAITRMGGFRKIANLMNLSLAYKHRKPSGYWLNLENLQEEISRFQRNWGMDPAYMPSRKSFERAGRYDIARALEKWGGLQEVSRLLSLELRHPRRRTNSETERQHDSKGTDAPNVATDPSVSQDPEKWLTRLKDLDITWVEK